MAPPLPKSRDLSKPLLVATNSQELLKTDPTPKPPGYCTYFTYLFLGTSIIIGGLAPCTYFLSHNCTKAEEMVQRICDPELKRVQAITDITIPDFGMSPIAMDIAKKCEDITDCLSAVKCYRLRSISPLPPRCPIFQFFNQRFLQCRQKLIDNSKIHKIQCVKIFFGAGPIQCHLLNDNIDCVIEQVLDLCEGDEVEYDFRKFIDEYRLIIDCPEVPEIEGSTVES